MNPELNYYLGFSAFIKIGPVRFKRLLNFFKTAEKAFSAKAEDLEQAGLEPEITREFLAFKKRFNPEIWHRALQKHQIALVPEFSENYPALLKEIRNPPFLLYLKGDINLLNNDFNFAIVGTRRSSSYGKQAALEIAKDLSRHGLTIVSGGAKGIDTYSHHAALEAGGKTIAVLAGGLDESSFFPKQNTCLFKKIVENKGALISEVPPGAASMNFSFPNRNRIISGLSRGTLVVEAAKESGALITSQFALEQNRKIFAVPGSIYNPVSIGPNRLIQDGAQLVTSATDIIEALNLSKLSSFQKAQEVIPDNPQEAKILEHLSFEPMHIDKIAKRANLKIPEAAAVLATMEVKGKIRNLGGMNYVKVR